MYFNHGCSVEPYVSEEVVVRMYRNPVDISENPHQLFTRLDIDTGPQPDRQYEAMIAKEMW